MARRFSSSGLARIARVACTALLVVASSYCARSGKETNVQLTPDEEYLANAVAGLDAARGIRASNYEKSESLFAVLDSTIDTTRVAKTIRELRANPERWVYVFKHIEQMEANGGDTDPSSEQSR